MERLLVIALLFVTSCQSTSAIVDDAQYIGETGWEYTKIHVKNLENTNTINETYTALKNGLKRDTYPTRKILAGVAFPEMHDDYENSEINYHYDDRRILESSIYPSEKPDPYVIEEERKYKKLYEAKLAAIAREEKLRAAAEEKAKIVYCYKSLGYTDCYKEPQPGQEYRLVR